MASPTEVEKYLQQCSQADRKRHRELDAEVARQYKEEEQIIQKTMGNCPYLPERYPDPDRILMAMAESNDDYEALKAVMCTMNSMYFLPPDSGKSMRIRHYFQRLKRIAGGADGEVTLSEKPLLNQLFVIKTPKRPEANLAHEYFVGAYGTNTLRSRIPNFSYIYGMFKCSPMSLYNKQSIVYCALEERLKVNYVMYEKVKGVPLREFVTRCTAREYASVMTQVIFAIQLAADEIGFTHNDLHSGNVMVSTLERPISIRLDFNGTVGYLQTNVLAKIIDYGRAHIRYEGKNYGYSMPGYGIFPDRIYPMYDIYKLFAYTMFDAGPGTRQETDQIVNPEVFERGIPALEFFNVIPDELRDLESDTSEYLRKMISTYYVLAPEDEFIMMKPTVFFEAFSQAFSDVMQGMITTSPDAPLYGCAYNGTCKSFYTALTLYTADEYEHLDDPFIFYDLYLRDKNIVPQARQYLPRYEGVIQMRAKEVQSLGQLVMMNPTNIKEEALLAAEMYACVDAIKDYDKILTVLYEAFGDPVFINIPTINIDPVYTKISATLKEVSFLKGDTEEEEEIRNITRGIIL